MLVVGCSHPGIDLIVEAASHINKHIHLLVGGFHLVVAKDDEIARITTALRDSYQVDYVAPGHCTGEPTFAALKQAFGDRYLYAGLGTAIALNGIPQSAARLDQRVSPAFDESDIKMYRGFAQLAQNDND